MLKKACRLVLVLGACLMASSPGFSVPNTFHLMQIEQVIGGVGGNTSLQAIQLRMRLAGQNLVSQARLRAWDSAGANPVVVVDMMTNVANAAAGSHILIATPQFAATFPGAPPDFLITTPIPVANLPAGKLTFEDDPGTVYWGLAWGGAAYTGTNLGTIDNDADGNFNPPFAGPLPSSNNQALRFTGPFNAMSTNNAADYALTAGSATFTNNAGQSTTVPVEAIDFLVR
jgi:hypothetical protein